MRTGSFHKKYLGGIEAEIQKIERNNVVCAVVQSDDKVIVDAQSSLDTLMTANYEIGTKNIVIDKALIAEEFFYPRLWPCG